MGSRGVSRIKGQVVVTLGRTGRWLTGICARVGGRHNRKGVCFRVGAVGFRTGELRAGARTQQHAVLGK